jgi:hypothetical protein
MASNLTSTPLGTAVAAFLLRAYGFKQKDTYEILADQLRGIDVSVFQPTMGGAAHKNLSKALFQKTRDTLGGARNAPPWLPNGVRLGDYLATCLGFADEAELDDYTLTDVGALSFTPPATMGNLSSGSPQRNLRVAHYDWTGANAATAANGNTGSTAVHSMGDALDMARDNGRFDLAALVAGKGGNAPPAPPAPVTPPVTPPTEDDDDDEVEVEVDMTPPEEALPLPDEMPPAPAPVRAPTPPPAPTGKPIARSSLVNPAIAGTEVASPAWLKPMNIADLPTPASATRTLNKGTWESRQRSALPDAFPSLPATDNQSFYPAVGPVYIVLDTWFPGKDFGPADDYTFRRVLRDGDTDLSLSIQDTPAPHYRMIIALKRDKIPQFYLLGDDGYTVPYDLASGGASSSREVGAKMQNDQELGFSIEWDENGIAEVIRFQLERSGARGGSMKDFEIRRDDGGRYRFTEAPADFMTTTTLVMQGLDDANVFTESVREDREQFVGAIDGGLYTIESNTPKLIPSDANPTLTAGSASATMVAGMGLDADDQDILIYGLPTMGMGGRQIDSQANAYEVLGNSLIFPNRVEVFTNVDQYQGIPDESDFLSRVALNWDTDTDVVEIYKPGDNTIASMQIRFQDASDTTTEYSGIVPDDVNAPREQRIYLPGDIPEQLLPLGVPFGSTVTSILAYPQGSSVYQRILVIFTTPTGESIRKEFPDSSNRAILSQPNMMGTDTTVSGRVVPHALNGVEGYISVSDLPPQYNGSHAAFTQDVMEIRMMERSSSLNTTLPTGDIRGVRQVVWREGGAFNILVPNPDDPEEMISISLVLEEQLQ